MNVGVYGAMPPVVMACEACLTPHYLISVDCREQALNVWDRLAQNSGRTGLTEEARGLLGDARTFLLVAAQDQTKVALAQWGAKRWNEYTVCDRGFTGIRLGSFDCCSPINILPLYMAQNVWDSMILQDNQDTVPCTCRHEEGSTPLNGWVICRKCGIDIRRFYG